MGIFRRVKIVRYLVIRWLPFLAALLALAGASPAWAESPPSRGKAYVAVNADVSDRAGRDTVSIRIVNNTDRKKLLEIALALGVKLNTSPEGMTYAAGDPRFVEDGGIGLEFTMPVVPRGDGTLPIAPFIEVLARHVSELQILYIIQGPFTYRGVQQYTENGIRVTVDPPETTPPNAPMAMAFYGINVSMDNPTPGPVQIPRYSPQEGHARAWRIVGILGLILLAGLIGAGVGLLAVRLLARWKAAAGLEERDS
ncbi:MAG: hypothetical protein BWY76_01008 [bacterium ADurb.Bin429]|nr:MAG: hypothetical protein BWY76_01008 [bacterium ADurb.Bin429]